MKVPKNATNSNFQTTSFTKMNDPLTVSTQDNTADNTTRAYTGIYNTIGTDKIEDNAIHSADSFSMDMCSKIDALQIKYGLPQSTQKYWKKKLLNTYENSLPSGGQAKSITKALMGSSHQKTPRSRIVHNNYFPKLRLPSRIPLATSYFRAPTTQSFHETECDADAAKDVHEFDNHTDVDGNDEPGSNSDFDANDDEHEDIDFIDVVEGMINDNLLDNYSNEDEDELEHEVDDYEHEVNDDEHEIDEYEHEGDEYEHEVDEYEHEVDESCQEDFGQEVDDFGHDTSQYEAESEYSFMESDDAWLTEGEQKLSNAAEDCTSTEVLYLRSLIVISAIL